MGGTLPRPTCRCMSSWVRASIIVSDSVTVMFVDGGRATLVGAQIALESGVAIYFKKNAGKNQSQVVL